MTHADAVHLCSIGVALTTALVLVAACLWMLQVAVSGLVLVLRENRSERSAR